jgi:hypothetical protein
LCSSSLSLNSRWCAGQYPGRALHSGPCPGRALCTVPSLLHPTNQGWNWGSIPWQDVMHQPSFITYYKPKVQLKCHDV